MRIRAIDIAYWRHFENISLDLSGDPPLVCIVGANGTGKSHILELVSACAHDLGLSPGVDIPRGNVFSDPHSVRLTFHLAHGVSEAVDDELSTHAEYEQWDRTIEIISINNPTQNNKTIMAGGIADTNEAQRFAQQVISRLRATESVHFLTLDADRSYPKRNIHVNQIAEAYDIDWGGSEYTKGRSFKPSTTLYDEWLKYFLARENQAGTKFMQASRRATQAGQPQPVFEDHFSSFRIALQKVLPHMMFTGVDAKKRTLLFDTTGLELDFNQLSGGEREIAFQVGQIDRFGLRRGLFLLDEPELHLNADLIRQWVSYLTSTVENGQIWLATHSLEAVEAAGPSATFVLERNDVTKKVDSLARLDSRPIISALSRAVGTPAFSISQLRFIYIEGEERLGERERYRRLAGQPTDVRFMEGGSCNEVRRRLEDVRALAQASGAGIRIGAIVDRDFRHNAAVSALEQVPGLFVLPALECENLFLDPATLQALLTQNGQGHLAPADLILAASDARAGAWMFQYAMATPNASTLPAFATPRSKERAKALGWAAIAADIPTACRSIADLSEFDKADKAKFAQLLEIAAKAYATARQGPDLWKRCEGKQVLSAVAPQAGLSGTDAFIQAATAAWERNAAPVPLEVQALRGFVAGL